MKYEFAITDCIGIIVKRSSWLCPIASSGAAICLPLPTYDVL